MLLFGILCGYIAAASAGYASSASGAGLYNTNSYNGQYGSNYPYSNQYTGQYSSAGGFPQVLPFGPYGFQDYYNQLSSANANLFNQQLAYQQQLFDQIRNQAFAGAGAGGFGGSFAGTGNGGFAGTGNGAGFASTGTYGGAQYPGSTYGGSFGGGNYASSGGSVGPGGQQLHASIYPGNAHSPNLDSRFGGDSQPGVSYSQGQPGTVGVSSFSSSSDVNGVKHRESATSVNNNGKVTTYHVRN